MTWEYRLIKVNGAFGVYEVYYEDGKVVSYSQRPASPRGEDIEAIKEDFKRYSAALDKPAIEVD
ncbi:hypothetical protein GCM10011309_24620 [Litorimonas cladophorae]|uniref:Uncharacterized protein n=1 Tax=Litorimonas cladophorae TaxID=1220491 RepID=A0A918KS00_9PROT|nr:hypothetical protein GCM10011309_24620 [Litorimonas cladophorae]